MASEEKVNSLIQIRGRVKSKLTRFETFIEKCKQDIERRSELPSRLETVQGIWNEFDEIQCKIEQLDCTDSQDAERGEFEDRYHELITEARNLCIKESTTNVNNSTMCDNATSISVKLPVIELPKFNGSYENWISFTDLFNSLIDKNSSLSDAQKLHYLKCSLTNEAAYLIETLEINNDNYSIAWDILKSRFERKKKIIEIHTKAILRLQPLLRESHTDLRKLLNDLYRHLQTLKKLDQPVDQWDSILIQIIIQKLDRATIVEWERLTADSEDIPTFDQFNEFLSRRCFFLEAIPKSKSDEFKEKASNSFSKSKRSIGSISYLTSQDLKCCICKQPHKIFHCTTFRNLSLQSRFEEVKKHKLCRNCLKSFHGPNCQLGCCKLCKANHHTLLHKNLTNIGSSVASKNESKGCENDRVEHRNQTPRRFEVTETASSSFGSSNINPIQRPLQEVQNIILATAILHIKDHSGRYHECRALLDSCSQSNFMTVELCNRLQLQRREANVTIRSLGQHTVHTNHLVNTSIKSRYNNLKIDSSFFVIDKIIDRLPVVKINVKQLIIPPNITLADPDFYMPNKVDILLGASLFWDLLCIGQIRTSKNEPIFQKTQLGWIVSGNIHQPMSKKFSQCYLTADTTLQNQIEKFWSIEEVGYIPHLSREEEQCELHFAKTYKRDTDGRFDVQLPFKADPTVLGDSKKTALKRFLYLERRLNQNPSLRDQYHKFMQEYLQLNHMSEVIEDAENMSCYYLPHHPVVREESSTTKVRVVFDGSSKTESGKSLNDILLVGPTIQSDLISIILRFRQHKYALSADIAKMYRQITINPGQRDFQRIVWRWKSSEPVKTFRLNTVTYGLSSSPFLAIRCLQQLGKDNLAKYPSASNAIMKDFYVDDLLTGEDSLTNLSKLKHQVIKILATAQFTLRKWKASDPRLMGADGLEEPEVEFGEGEKLLGLIWNTKNDYLSYRWKVPEAHRKTTKRIVLSIVSQIFDPLGLVGPIIIKIKMMLQCLWQLKIDWDESLPMEMHTSWQKWLQEVNTISQFTISRRILCDNPKSIELHGFCDASEAAYGACVYVRSCDDEGYCTVRLICAKSRVAPLKKITLPRLELCAAILLANLCTKVTNSLTCSFDGFYYWSDSKIVLSWITGEPNCWKTFVANRVAEIQQITEKSEWHHVSSELNPADIISRGTDPASLRTCDLWWQGPPFLQLHNFEITPFNQKSVSFSDIPEHKETGFTFTTTSSQNAVTDLLYRCSSLSRIKRILAYCLRFINNSRASRRPLEGPLTAQELEASLIPLIKTVQAEKFSEELSTLLNKGQVPKNSKLATLNPFILDGIIRVGGRLENAFLDYDHKHPVVLPKNHIFTTLLIRYEHYRQLHSGAQALLVALRSKYWILSGKTAVRSVLRKCIVCFRARPSRTEQLMGNLPEIRVKPIRPFEASGVDYAGPFSIKISRNVSSKAYLCLFVCLCTKAVHLELVSSLSSEAFINALKRFTARRGKCRILYSDNGSNFVGANKELRRLAQLYNEHPAIPTFCAEESITWKFIAPYSPHLGGLWEAAIKSAKFHLKRIVGSTLLSFEELYTVFTLIESCLNSRPLLPISNDPTDLQVLTPAHFLVGEPLTSIPEPSTTELPNNRLRRWQLLSQLRQHFWTRWSNEYLCQLQQRYKWKTENLNLTPGMMVLLREENLPPNVWSLGRIESTHPGADGLVRVVTVRTIHGLCRRAVTKICVLPIDDNDHLDDYSSASA